MNIETLTRAGFTFTQNPEGSIYEFDRGEVCVLMYPLQPKFRPDVYVGEDFIGQAETVGELNGLLKRKGIA